MDPASPLLSFPRKRESNRFIWIPHQVRDDKKEYGSPIRNASLSVEDDKGCVIPASPLCHSRENGNPDPTGSPIRSALLLVEDGKGVE